MSNGTGVVLSTNVPSIVFDLGTGFVAPSGQEILAGVEADINAAFGNNLNFNLNTPQGQLASSEAAIIANVDALFVYMSNQMNPSFATGRFQDGIGYIYFLQRMASVPTALQLVCNGLNGVTIPVGAAVIDPSQNIYTCTGSAVIGGTGAQGSVQAQFEAVIPGPTPVPQQVSIYQAIPGWDSAVVLSGVVGQPTETQAEFEARRAASVAGNSFGPIGAIIGAVAAVPDVIDFYGFNNNTGSAVTQGGVTIPPYAIYVCVAGGATQAVANAIFSKKGAGAPMVGNTTVTVFDSNPLYANPIPYQITFEIPTNLLVAFDVTLVPSSSIPSNGVAQVQQAILNAFLGENPNISRARIGTTIYATNYVSAINALGSWAQVASISIGSPNTPDSVFTGSCGGTALIVTGSVGGSILAGQFLFGSLGGTAAILNATQIIAQVTGSPGGAGAYTINQPQTFPSQPIKGFTADQSSVSVLVNQEPLLFQPYITVGT